MNRRRLLRRTAAAIPVLTLGAKGVWAAEKQLPRVEESNATAAALSYVHDAEKSPKRTTPAQETQFCDNCIHYVAKTEEDGGWGTCAVIPGYLVAAKGWCMVWVAKPPAE